MKEINGGTQMRDIWTLPAIARWEKAFGKHPTQKPLPLLARIILASTKENAWILDPFTGSSTTGIAANLLERNFLGIDKDIDFLDLSVKRRKEIEDIKIKSQYREKILKYSDRKINDIIQIRETKIYYGIDLLIE
jgi:DNA-methyltransferase